MPFRALTWTRTFVALEMKSGMIWYCDTLHHPEWQSRMKWVMPQEVSPWFSFGTYDTPRACGFQVLLE
jgi:hypothetical protein